MENVIEFKSVSKKFKRGQKGYLKQAILDIFRQEKQEDFWALDTVSFEIKKGEAVGIIGTNGSGKSTILKLIAGVLQPTKGTVSIQGKISPLIELGAGFHPDLTGRENIYLNGTILGLTKRQIDEKFESIVAFAELEDFINTPVKHYSSGMYMRLGFAISVHVDPDILLVDEILAIGDHAFQKKCFDKMREFRKKGVTIVFISHALETVKDFCDRVIWLNNGKVESSGEPDKMVKKYLEKAG